MNPSTLVGNIKLLSGGCAECLDLTVSSIRGESTITWMQRLTTGITGSQEQRGEDVDKYVPDGPNSPHSAAFALIQSCIAMDSPMKAVSPCKDGNVREKHNRGQDGPSQHGASPAFLPRFTRLSNGTLAPKDLLLGGNAAGSFQFNNGGVIRLLRTNPVSIEKHPEVDRGTSLRIQAVPRGLLGGGPSNNKGAKTVHCCAACATQPQKGWAVTAIIGLSPISVNPRDKCGRIFYHRCKDGGVIAM